MSVLAAFPRRAFVLKPGRGNAGAWFLGLFGVLMMFGVIVWMAADVVPSIRSDFAIRNTAQPAANARISEGSCRSRLFLMQNCRVTVRWRGKDGMRTQKLSYYFVEPHMGSWSVQVMADPQQPDVVTTDLGLERLTNRVLTAIGIVAILVAVVAGAMIAARRILAMTRRVKALSGRVLEPVPVRFEGTGTGTNWVVQDEHGARHEWPARKSDKPFVLDDGRGLVLALREPAGGPAFPLDEKLRLVVLTPEERAQILAARA